MQMPHLSPSLSTHLLLLLPLLLLLTPLLDASATSHLISAAARQFNPRHPLTVNLAGVTVNLYSYRTRSLEGRGATIGEFQIPRGVVVWPPVQRVLVVHEDIGNLSSVYESYENLTGFRLVSPVAGLLVQSSSSSENGPPAAVELVATGEPILVNFTLAALNRSDVGTVSCVRFALDGGVEVFEEATRNVCATRREGLFGLVVREVAAVVGNGGGDGGGRDQAVKKRWREVGVWGSVGVGALVVVVGGVVGVRRRRRNRRVAEMEKRTFEEEATKVSMVGHVFVPMDGASSSSSSVVDSKEIDRVGSRGSDRRLLR